MSTGISNLTWVDVQYANNLFMIVSANSPPRASTSPDGINWTTRASPPVSGTTAVAYGNGRWVVVGQSGPDRAAYSTDNGASWTPATTDLSSHALQTVTFGAGRFVAAGNSGSIVTSIDGANWTTVTPPLVRNWLASAYGHGLFIIASDSSSGRRVMTSVDGFSWTNVTSSALPGGFVLSLFAGPDRFYLTSIAPLAVWYSTN